MSCYLLIVAYPDAGRRRMREEQESRRAALTDAIAHLGGRVNAAWVVPRKGDLAVLLEMPDCESVGALVTSLIAGGTVKDIKIAPQLEPEFKALFVAGKKTHLSACCAES